MAGIAHRLRVVVVVACFAAGCCGSASLAAPCLDPSAGQSVGVHVASPALECHSRLCLVDAHDGGAATALCTTECSSDDDCAAMGRAYCRDGYGCMLVSGFRRRVCACRTSAATP